MSDDFFDIERLRKNWSLLPEETLPGLPAVLELEQEEVSTPEPLETALELLAKMEQLARLRFPAQRATLESFFRQANTLLEQQRRARTAQPLVEVQPTLDSLEELLEVFTLELALGAGSRRV
jgi:hypothetical protein